MRTHVFIVDDNTFPVHLKYLFAGTGAKDRDMHIGLLSDIKRVRPNDLVIFYIEATEKIKGGFYGIFRIAEQNPILYRYKGWLISTWFVVNVIISLLITWLFSTLLSMLIIICMFLSLIFYIIYTCFYGTKI